MDIIKDILGKTQFEGKKLLDESKLLVKKWEKTGLLEGLKSSKDKGIVAQLLENQTKQLLVEASRTGTSAGSEEWSGVALPLVRRVFAEIAAKDFVSVQPMNLPSGLVFYLDFKYGTGQPGFTTGSGKNSQLDSVFGVTGKEAAGQNASGGLYGSGRFGYSLNDTQSIAIASGSTTATQFEVVLNLTGSSASFWNYDTQFSSSYASLLAANTVYAIRVTGSLLPSFDSEGVAAFKIFNSSGSNIAGYFPAFTSYNPNTGNVTFVVSGSAGTGWSAAERLKVEYHKQPSSTSRGDFEDQGSTLQIPEINLELKSEAITAKTRKLKAIWTPEYAQDLNAYHSVDAEAELTAMLSEYISQEIDLELLAMLIENAQTIERWSTRPARSYDGGTGVFSDYSTNQAAASAYNQQTWFQTLGTKIQKVSNMIHQKTLRGGANWLVCSPQASTILESLNGFSANSGGEDSQYTFGVEKVGTINGRIKVYKNPYMVDNQLLMGFRGAQFLETGAAYCPYIPLMMTPIVYDPDNFTPRKAIMTRYAKKVTRPEFFGLIQIDNLGDI